MRARRHASAGHAQVVLSERVIERGLSLRSTGEAGAPPCLWRRAGPGQAPARHLHHANVVISSRGLWGGPKGVGGGRWEGRHLAG
jgi:hypothetical protein